MQFLELPLESLLEIVARLELDDLLRLLLAFPELLPLVRLYRGFKKLNFTHKGRKRNKHAPVILDRSVKEIIPEISQLDISKFGSRVPAFIEIVELHLRAQEKNTTPDTAQNWVPRWVIFQRTQAIASAIRSKQTFVRLVGHSLHFDLGVIHSPLVHACRAKGASLSYGSLPILESSFFYNYRSPLRKRKCAFAQITSIQISGLAVVDIPQLPAVINMHVVLEQTSTRGRASFRIANAPLLRKLSIHYKGP